MLSGAAHVEQPRTHPTSGRMNANVASTSSSCSRKPPPGMNTPLSLSVLSRSFSRSRTVASLPYSFGVERGVAGLPARCGVRYACAGVDGGVARGGRTGGAAGARARARMDRNTGGEAMGTASADRSSSLSDSSITTGGASECVPSLTSERLSEPWRGLPAWAAMNSDRDSFQTRGGAPGSSSADSHGTRSRAAPTSGSEATQVRRGGDGGRAAAWSARMPARASTAR